VDAVCLVIPCYNEARRLDVRTFETFMAASPQVSFCFVDDGSRDGTIDVLNGLARSREGQVKVVRAAANGGKAEAVRLGMLQAAAWKPFGFVGYWDADLAAPLDELLPMLQRAAECPDCLMVLGSRVKRLGVAVERRLARHYPGRVFATAASMVLRLPVYDTQCGAKLVAASMVPRLFAEPFRSRWIFDVEMLARLRNLVGRESMLRRVIEVPLGAWRETSESRVSWHAYARAPFELWSIERRFNRGRADDPGER
jgi:glycosyltransferase involved in cell wall biosynthesis